jgi:hypothetical protein
MAIHVRTIRTTIDESYRNYELKIPTSRLASSSDIKAYSMPLQEVSKLFKET